MSELFGGRGVARDADYEGDEFAPWGIPSLWKWLTVANIGAVALGRQRSPKDHAGPQMRRYVRAANITWGGWSLDDVKEMNFDDDEFAHFRLRDGDVLINEGSGSAKEVGKPAIWRAQIQNCCFQNTLLRVRPTDTSPEYLYLYFLFSALAGRFVSSTQGVNIFHIGKLGLAKFPVPVPPPSEQSRIVGRIDSLSGKSKRARDHLDHIPLLVRKYKQAILGLASSGQLSGDWRKKHSAEPWTASNVSEVAQLVFDGPFGSNLKSDDYTDSGARVVRLENIGHLHFVSEKETYISHSKHERLKRHTLRPNDILFSSFVDEEIRVCLFPDNPTEVAINKADCFCVRVDPSICEPRWLAFRLACRSTYEVLKKAVHGATRPRVNLAILKAYPLSLPSINEQREIVRRIEHAFTWIDRLAAEATSARKLVDRLDQAVLAKAFRGELVPQDPNDEPASRLLDRIRAERGTGSATASKRKARKAKV